MGWLEDFKKIAEDLSEDFRDIVETYGASWPVFLDWVRDRLGDQAPRTFRSKFFELFDGPDPDLEFASAILGGIATLPAYTPRCAEVIAKIDQLAVRDIDRLVYEFWGQLPLDELETARDSTRSLVSEIRNTLANEAGLPRLLLRPHPLPFTHNFRIDAIQREVNFRKSLLAVLHVKEQGNTGSISSDFRKAIDNYVELWNNASQLTMNREHVLFIFLYQSASSSKWWQSISEDQKFKPYIDAGRILHFEVDNNDGFELIAARTTLNEAREKLRAPPGDRTSGLPQKAIFILDSKFPEYSREIEQLVPAFGDQSDKIAWFTAGNPQKTILPEPALLERNAVLFIHRLLNADKFGTTKLMKTYHDKEVGKIISELYDQDLISGPRFEELRNSIERFARIYWRSEGNWDENFDRGPIWTHSGDANSLNSLIRKILGLKTPGDAAVDATDAPIYAAFEEPKKDWMKDLLDAELEKITRAIKPEMRSERVAVRLSEQDLPILFKKKKIRPERLNIILGNIETGAPRQPSNVSNFLRHTALIEDAIRQQEWSEQKFPLLRIAAVWSEPDGERSFPNVSRNKGLSKWNFVHFNKDGADPEDLEVVSKKFEDLRS